MLKEFFKKALNKTPAVIIIVGVFVFSAASAQSLKNLTSNEKAKEVAPKIPTPQNPAMGGELKKHSLGLGVGQTFLNGDFDENGEDKITFDLLYNYSASYSFDFMMGAHRSSHEFRGKKTVLQGLTMGIKAKLYQIDSFSPYAMGGFGFYAPKLTRIINNVPTESESKTVFGYHIGAGGELKLNRNVAVGLLGQYHNPFDQKQENQAEVEGSYFKLLITAMYIF